MIKLVNFVIRKCIRTSNVSFHYAFLSLQRKEKVRCFDSIWLPQFPSSSASSNIVESHCLLYTFQIFQNISKFYLLMKFSFVGCFVVVRAKDPVPDARYSTIGIKSPNPIQLITLLVICCLAFRIT